MSRGIFIPFTPREVQMLRFSISNRIDHLADNGAELSPDRVARLIAAYRDLDERLKAYDLENL